MRVGISTESRLPAAFKLFVILAWVVVAPSWSNATVFWEDGFEPGNTGYAIVGGMSYSTSPVYSGTYSLKEHFLGGSVQSGGYSDRYFPYATEDLWSRFYLYLNNFTVNETQTKLMLQGSECCYPSFWWGMIFGQAVLSVQVQGIKGGSETMNLSGPSIPQNRWACVETHIKMNSPGVPNGVVEAWIDGGQGLARYDLLMRDASASGKNSPTANFTFNRLYVQHGTGDLYLDNLAFGDQRIGCSGLPPQINNPAPQVQTPAPSPQVETPAPAPQVQTPAPVQPSPGPPPAPQGLFFR